MLTFEWSAQHCVGTKVLFFAPSHLLRWIRVLLMPSLSSANRHFSSVIYTTNPVTNLNSCGHGFLWCGDFSMTNEQPVPDIIIANSRGRIVSFYTPAYQRRHKTKTTIASQFPVNLESQWPDSCYNWWVQCSPSPALLPFFPVAMSNTVGVYLIVIISVNDVLRWTESESS